MIDPKAFYTLSYGLYVVTSGDKNNGNGFVANSVFQVTSDPPRIAVSCNKKNHTYTLIEKHQVFALSVLSVDASRDIISDFGYKSGKDTNKLQGKAVIYGETGVPVFTTDCLSYMECKVVQRFDVGTHVIFIGELMHSQMLDDSKKALTYDYYREVYKAAAPENAPTYVEMPSAETSVKAATDYRSYKCTICGYTYEESDGDPTQGIEAGTLFSDLPHDWVCPICRTVKDDFKLI